MADVYNDKSSIYNVNVKTTNVIIQCKIPVKKLLKLWHAFKWYLTLKSRVMPNKTIINSLIAFNLSHHP